MAVHVDVDVPQLWRDYRSHPSIEMRNQLVERYLPLVNTMPNAFGRDCRRRRFGRSYQRRRLRLDGRHRRFRSGTGGQVRDVLRASNSGAMLDELRTMDWVPRLVRSKASKMEEARKTLEAHLGRPPRSDEMAERLGVPIEEYEKMHTDATAVSQVSLNKKWYETDSYKDVREIDILEDKKAEDPTHRLQNSDLMRLVTRGLNRNERLIIILYYTRT